MTTMSGKNVAVIGASRGLGRAIVAQAYAEDARILAVARQQFELNQLTNEFSGLESLAADASLERTPEAIFETFDADAVILSAGARPPTSPLPELTWEDFSINWEVDVKASFLLCRAALLRPLKRGAYVVLISSGAGIGGSPISGGYSGAKRMQMFLARYAQRESERLGLGINFLAIAPGRIMPQTELGQDAVRGYARYLKMNAEEFIAGMEAPQTPDDVARAVLDFTSGRRSGTGAYIVTGLGTEELA